jgi:hypothetical protein
VSKDEFVKELSQEGYDVGFSSYGIPTVFVKESSMFHTASLAIKAVSKKVGYDQSYGISLLKANNTGIIGESS